MEPGKVSMVDVKLARGLQSVAGARTAKDLQDFAITVTCASPA
jgi:hypothetical protein